MQLIAKLRSLRWLPRVALTLFALATIETTLLPCAMADSTPAMGHHCTHCPTSHSETGACATVLSADSSSSANVHPLVPAFDHPPMQIVFDVREFPLSRVAPLITAIPPPISRLLHLTHCVQLK